MGTFWRTGPDVLPIKFELGPLQGVLKFFLLYSAFGAGSLTQQLIF